jgi:hypothetical protein
MGADDVSHWLLPPRIRAIKARRLDLLALGYPAPLSLARRLARPYGSTVTDVDAAMVDVDAAMVDVDAAMVDVDAAMVDVDAAMVDVGAAVVDGTVVCGTVVAVPGGSVVVGEPGHVGTVTGDP